MVAGDGTDDGAPVAASHAAIMAMLITAQAIRPAHPIRMSAPVET